MEIETVISGFVSKKVVVIGDVMIDEYVRGKVQRMSPEMPVPLLLRPTVPGPEEDLIRLGGAGNTARNIASLGAEVVLIGVCGETDPASRQLAQVAANHEPDGASQTPHRFKIDCRLIVQPDLRTTHKMRMLSDQSIQLFRVDTETPQHLTPETEQAILEAFRTAAAWCDVVIVSDYAKGMFLNGLFGKLRATCHDKPILVDPKELKVGQRFEKYRGADIIIPNAAELKKSFGLDDTDETLKSFFAGDLQLSLQDIGVKAIICTRGPKGIIYSDSVSDRGIEVAGKDVEVADVTGASDTVIATVALARAQIDDLAMASRIAEAAGRIKVTKRLTGSVHMSELLEALDPLFQRRARAKLHIEQPKFLSAIADQKKARGKDAKTALVTGCFDILHCGHVKLLELAAEYADVVIVAINSDDYIRRVPHKSGGPYVDEQSRATLVASLASVDLVTIFNEDTPESLIKLVQPNFLVMGQEYEPQFRDSTLPGLREIERTGGQVIFAEWQDTRGLSSSAIARRIRRT